MDETMWFGLVICAVIVAFAIYTRLSERNKGRRAHKEFKEIVPDESTISAYTEITLPMSMGIKNGYNGDQKDGDIDLATVDSISVQDELGQEIELLRPNIETDQTQYREIQFSNASHLTGSAVKISVPVAQQMFTAASLAKMAPNGLFTATVNPATLSLFVKDGTYSTMIHGPNGIISHSGFKPVAGIAAINPVMAVGIAMQAMAAVSGQYYLQMINSRLTSIEGKLDQVVALLNDRDKGYILHAHKRLVQICGHEILGNIDVQEIRNLANDVGPVYATYRSRYEDQKAALLKYQYHGKGAQKQLSLYQAQVMEFYQTTQICAAAYQVYLQAKLAEATVTWKIDPFSPKLEDIKKDAREIYNDAFDSHLVTNPEKAMSWVLDKAQDCLKQTNLSEEVAGAFTSRSKKTENRKKQLEPIITNTRELCDYIEAVLDLDSSRMVIEGISAPMKTLILPAKDDQPVRIFIETKMSSI